MKPKIPESDISAINSLDTIFSENKFYYNKNGLLKKQINLSNYKKRLTKEFTNELEIVGEKKYKYNSENKLLETETKDENTVIEYFFKNDTTLAKTIKTTINNLENYKTIEEEIFNSQGKTVSIIRVSDDESKKSSKFYKYNKDNYVIEQIIDLPKVEYIPIQGIGYKFNEPVKIKITYTYNRKNLIELIQHFNGESFIGKIEYDYNF